MARSLASRAARPVAVLAGLLLSWSSSATVTLSSFPPNPGVLPGGGWQYTAGTTFGNPTGPRAWVNGVYGGVPKIAAVDSMSLAGRAGPLAVQTATRMGVVDAAGAVARCLAGGGVICGAATAAALLYTAYRVYNEPDSQGNNPGLKFDPGIVPTSSNQKRYVGAGGALFTSLGGACSSFNGPLAGHPELIYAYAAGNETGGPTTGGGQCLATQTAHIGYPSGYGRDPSVDFTVAWNITQVSSCPPSVDFYDPAFSIPGGQPVGLDGKCPSARSNHVPVTPTEAAAKVGALPPVGQNMTNLTNATGQAIDTGGQTAPGDVSASGPASQTGTPETVTQLNPDGSTVTTTKTPTYNYTYSGDKITYGTTYNTTTQTCTAAGSCSTTVVNATGTVAAPQDPNDPCTANPSRVGCASLGDPPTDVVPKKTSDVSFSSESLGVVGSCPSPVPLGNSGKSISYQTVCDGVTQARPLIIAMGFLMAAGIMLGALKVGL